MNSRRVDIGRLLVQSQHAMRIVTAYRAALEAKGFRLLPDGESIAPPEGMSVEDAMRLSQKLWDEANEGNDGLDS